MKRVVTTNATILCSHGGRVVLDAGQQIASSEGSLILREGDVVGRPIVGCGRKKKRCTTVVSATGTSPTLTVVGRPAHLETLTGMTNRGGTIRVVDPGQSIVLA